MVISGLREVTSCAAAVISPLIMWICDRVSGFLAQPASKKKTIVANATKIVRNGARSDNEDNWTKLYFGREVPLIGFSRGARPPREFFTTSYAALRVAAAPCKTSIAFFTTGSSVELDAAGG